MYTLGIFNSGNINVFLFRKFIIPHFARFVNTFWQNNMMQLGFEFLDIVQYRLRPPLRSKDLITSRSRVPPSPKVREKAKSLSAPFICAANNIHYYNSVGQRGIFIFESFFDFNRAFANFFNKIFLFDQ